MIAGASFLGFVLALGLLVAAYKIDRLKKTTRELENRVSQLEEYIRLEEYMKKEGEK